MRALLLFLLTLILAVAFMPTEAQSTPTACGSAPAPRLLALELGRVVEGGVANNLRAEPSVTAMVVGQMPPGAVFNVLSQSECADGYRWYQVVYRGDVGWTAEGSGDDYFLEPYTVEAVEVEVTWHDDLRVFNTQWLNLVYDTPLASAVSYEQDPGYTFPESMSPRPRSALFRFEGFPGFRPDDACCQAAPLISLYPVSGFYEIGDRFDADIDALRSLLNTRPILADYEPREGGIRNDDDLPFLPQPNAAQVFALAPQYVDFSNGTGVRYVTAYAQQLAEFDQYSLFYTFQGLTDDGATYISAQFPLVLPGSALPDYVAGDYEDMMPWYWPYFLELVDNLQALDDGDYTPDLALLDGMMESMWVGVVE
jgi:hypothetical protein